MQRTVMTLITQLYYICNRPYHPIYQQKKEKCFTDKISSRITDNKKNRKKIKNDERMTEYYGKQVCFYHTS